MMQQEAKIDSKRIRKSRVRASIPKAAVVVISDAVQIGIESTSDSLSTEFFHLV